jgi:IS605 OrfB family transposase
MESEWIPKLNDKYHYLETDSWFNMKLTNRTNKLLYIHKTKNNGYFTRCKKIIIYPNNQQSKILQFWFELSRLMYNRTTKFIENNIFDSSGKLVLNKINEFVNFKRIRSKYLKKYRDKLRNKKIFGKKINAHILDQTIARCVAAYDGCITKYKNGQIKDFDIREIKSYKRYKTLLIESGLFSKKINGFCTTMLGSMKTSEPLNIIKTSTLSYDKYTSRYVLYVPQEIQGKTNETRNLVCGIDPGIRTFLTVYSKEDVLEIGNNINFDKYYDKIDKINKNLNKESRKYKKAMGKVYDKLNNKVKDMHYKVSKYLCSYYRKIKLGKISTKSITSKTNDIPKIVKRKAYTLSHYKFREIMAQQAEKYGVKLKIVSEYNTTKMCSKCKNLKNVGKNEIYKCDNEKCKLRAGRDVNAAKNIRYV